MPHNTMITTPSEQVNSCASVGQRALSHILPRTYAACKPWTLIAGWNTATHPQIVQLWPEREQRTALRNHTMFAFGELEMRLGDAAEISVLRSTPRNFGASLVGSRAMGSVLPLWVQVRTTMIW